MKATLVVDPRAASRLVWSLIGPASGRAVQQGQSLWKGRLGKRAVSKKLTLTDDPLIPRGLGSRPFDGEGIAAKRFDVIKDGALQAYYLDTYYARKLGMEPTTGGSSNVIVKPGKGGLQEHVGRVKKGVYVTSWLGGNSDGTSGEFSLGLRGHLIERGEIGKPVGEMNVTGNLLELFGRLTAVGMIPGCTRRCSRPRWCSRTSRSAERDGGPRRRRGQPPTCPSNRTRWVATYPAMKSAAVDRLWWQTRIES